MKPYITSKVFFRIIYLIVLLHITTLSSSLADSDPGSRYQFANCEILTVKYDSEGQVEWEARHNGPMEGKKDKGYGIALDEAGNAYVAGKSPSDSGSFVVIKYSPAGKKLWTAHAGDESTRAIDIAVSPSGDILIAGGGEKRLLLASYTTNGKQNWLVDYTAMLPEETASCLAVDSEGNACVLGYTYRRDLVVVKYDADGNQLWVREKDLASPVRLSATIRIDSSDNIVVSANRFGKEKQADEFYTMKLDGGGNLLWEDQHLALDGCHRVDLYYMELFSGVKDMSIGPGGNILVTGADGFPNCDFMTMKYDPDGNLLWSSQFDVGKRDSAFVVKEDHSGNVIVSGIGTDHESPSEKGWTLQYDSVGEETWKVFYTEGAYNGYHEFYQPKAINISDNGDAFLLFTAPHQISVYYHPGRASDYAHNSLFIKYDVNGNEIWREWYRTTKHWDHRLNAMALDEDGGVIATGTSCRMKKVYSNDDEGCGLGGGLGGTPIILSLTMLAIGLGAWKLNRKRNRQ